MSVVRCQMSVVNLTWKVAPNFSWYLIPDTRYPILYLSCPCKTTTMSFLIKSIEEYNVEYKKSIDHPEKFWDEIASAFQWTKHWTKTLEWNFIEPSIKWFINGKLNITENCLDRHLATRADDTALIWEPNEPKDKVQKYTYRELYDAVCKTNTTTTVLYHHWYNTLSFHH